LAEDFYAETIRIRVAVVVIEEVAALVAIHFVSAGAHERRKQRQGSLSLFSYTVTSQEVDNSRARVYDSLGNSPLEK
jgi:hypothetical protein